MKLTSMGGGVTATTDFANPTHSEISYWGGAAGGAIPGHETSDDVVRISAYAYLRSIWTLLVSCIRHPSSTTVIDLTTGKAITKDS